MPESLTLAPFTAKSRVASTPCFGLWRGKERSEEHTSELQSRSDLVCRLLLEKKKKKKHTKKKTKKKKKKTTKKTTIKHNMQSQHTPQEIDRVVPAHSRQHKTHYKHNTTTRYHAQDAHLYRYRILYKL